MCRIKIPQQYFELKMPGGLMHEGGHICGTLRYYHEHMNTPHCHSVSQILPHSCI